jgi:hypothetical protein
MKILKDFFLVVFCVTMIIQNIDSIAFKRSMLYQPNRDYQNKVSIPQETEHCIDICTECLNKPEINVYTFNLFFVFN